MVTLNEPENKPVEALYERPVAAALLMFPLNEKYFVELKAFSKVKLRLKVPVEAVFEEVLILMLE